MSLRKIARCVFYVLLFVTIIMLLILVKEKNDDMRSMVSELPNFLNTYLSQPKDEDRNTKQMWQNRVMKVREGCKSSEKGKYNITAGQCSPYFVHSSKANFSLCRVPKCGSTLWTLIYLFLEKGQPVQQGMQVTRGVLHTGASKYITPYKYIKDYSRGTLNILTTREPYSRLFSAYIDKIFLIQPEQQNMAKGIANKYNKGYYSENRGYCGYNVSFQEFLDEITNQALQGKHIDFHWCPVYHMCRVCEIKYDFVAIQDTLTQDTEHIVNNMLPIATWQKDSLKKLLHGKDGANDILGALIHEYMDHQKIAPKHCPDVITLLHKIWLSLKLHGYLRNDVDFPVKAFRNQTSITWSYVRDIFFTVISSNPLTRKEKQDQRRRALVDAYKSITPYTVQKLQYMYKMDFITFGFDINPPKV